MEIAQPQPQQQQESFWDAGQKTVPLQQQQQQQEEDREAGARTAGQTVEGAVPFVGTDVAAAALEAGSPAGVCVCACVCTLQRLSWPHGHLSFFNKQW